MCAPRLVEQLEHLGIDLEALEARARPGAYREPPHLSLDPVDEEMDATFHVSPDSGFPNLRAFLGRVKRHLTATMFEWDPNHISDSRWKWRCPATIDRSEWLPSERGRGRRSTTC